VILPEAAQQKAGLSFPHTGAWALAGQAGGSVNRSAPFALSMFGLQLYEKLTFKLKSAD
jgi:hypothetical protein